MHAGTNSAKTIRGCADQHAATGRNSYYEIGFNESSSNSVGASQARGIYAVVHVEEYIKQFQKANSQQLDSQFDSLYQNLLSNPAIAGLTLQVQWNTLNPDPPSSANAYDWNSVDDAFAQATAGKTVQLIVTPGFSSPQWALIKFLLAMDYSSHRFKLLSAIAGRPPS